MNFKPRGDRGSTTGMRSPKTCPIEGIRANIYSLPKDNPNEIIVGLNDRDKAYHDVYKVDLTTGDKVLLFENTEKMAGFTFDLEGNLRLATRQTEDGGTEILRYDGNTFTRIYKCNFEETIYPVRFHKDGEKVYFVTNKGKDVDLTRLTLMDPETGETTFIEFDPENQVDFGGAVFDAKTDELIATVYVGDRVRIYPKEKQIEKDLKFLTKKLPEGELSIQSSTRDMRFHLISISRDVDPGSVYLYDREDKNVDLLYRSRPELNSEHLAFMKPVRYQARDGLEIPGYLTVPRGVKTENLPTVIMPHGGPWARDYWGYNAYAQFLANRGYAVYQPNFRGSTGYGKSFLNAGNKEWGTGYMQHDITDAVKYLIKKGITDENNVAIFGGSYGGYATLAGLAFTPDVYTAGISYVGPSNLITLLESIPPYWGPIIKVFHKRLGNPEDPEDERRLRKQSPLFSADKIDDPLLVIQGANDPRVDKRESDQIVIAARERGLDVGYLVAEDEGHGFRGEENRLVVAAAMEKFLAQHLGGRYQEELSETVQNRYDKLIVDVSTVSLADTSLEVYAATAPLPLLDPEKITPFKAQYFQTIKTGGQEITVDVVKEVSHTTQDGNDYVLIKETSNSPQGTVVNNNYLDNTTLLPQKQTIDQTGVDIALEYEPDKITGAMELRGQKNDIDVDLDASILSSLETVVGTMNLKPGYKTTIRMFNLVQQKIIPYSLEVIGTETVSVPAGSFDTYKIEVTPLDGSTGKQLIYVNIEKPYNMVKLEAELPAMMGGGSTTIELKSIE
ncbi:MAG: prolyl oligopeptidase family serine peptidase [bacterium]